MIEALACFFLISFPLAVWFFFVVAKRAYRPRSHDNSLMGKLLSSNGASLPPRGQREADEPPAAAK